MIQTAYEWKFTSPLILKLKYNANSTHLVKLECIIYGAVLIRLLLLLMLFIIIITIMILLIETYIGQGSQIYGLWKHFCNQYFPKIWGNKSPFMSWSLRRLIKRRKKEVIKQMHVICLLHPIYNFLCELFEKKKLPDTNRKNFRKFPVRNIRQVFKLWVKKQIIQNMKRFAI